jgi:putative ATPase
MEPLASKIRPINLKEYVGQKHLVGENKPIYNAIKNKQQFSFILFGPPGVGKTTLAKIYAKSLDTELFELSAVSAKKSDIQKIAEYSCLKPKILFLDEIHRFNKAQQDYLLPHVESGNITLIGATTENPSFEVIPALMSRCRVYILNDLSKEEIFEILSKTGKLSKQSKEFVFSATNGDARQAISIIENVKNLYSKITLENLKDFVQNKFLKYDKSGEEHHNLISAFIKSMRASKTDATLYYLSRMIYSGEDPKFIARRMVIFASEDIGLSKPNALLIANNVFRAVETIGLPEASINLAHGAIYLSQCPKDRRVVDALYKVKQDVENYGNLKIPLKLRNATTKFNKDQGYGKDYNMYDKDDSFLPKEINKKKYFK